MDFALKHCKPCEEGGPPIPVQEAEILMKSLDGWQLWPGATTIAKSFTFKNFADAFAFATKIAACAEEEGHHPDLLISWGRVEVELTTHAVGGLSENDFILAAKIDAIE